MLKEYGELEKNIDFTVLKNFLSIMLKNTLDLKEIIEERENILKEGQEFLEELEETYKKEYDELLYRATIEPDFKIKVLNKYKELFLENMLELGLDISEIDNKDIKELIEGILAQKYLSIFEKEIRIKLVRNGEQKWEIENRI